MSHLHPNATSTQRGAVKINGSGDTAEDLANKGAASGYAGLDGSSRVAAANAPAKAVYVTGGGQAITPAEIDAIAENGSNPFTGDQSMGGFKLTSLGTPTASTDAATKAYADSISAGLDVKGSVRVASIGNINVASPGTVIDGVTLAIGDRILLKNQTTGSENGIYVFDTGATPLVRSTDADTSAEVTGGMFTFSTEGTSNADKGWVLTTNDPITLNTTALTFTQFSSASIVYGTPVSVGTANAAGASTDVSRADHVHNHSTFATGDQHTEYLKADGTRSLAGNLVFDAAGRKVGSDAARPDITSGEVFPQVVEKVAAYTIGTGDEVVLADPTAGAFAITLPAIGAATRKRRVTVKHSSASGNAVTVTPTGGDLIDGAATQVLASRASLTLVAPVTGTNWNII